MIEDIHRVGVVGLGAMGFGVAQSLLRAGFETHVCDLRAEPVRKIVEAGGHSAPDPAALGAAVDALVLLVVHAEQAESVLFGERGAASTLPTGAPVILSVTVAPDRAEALAARCADAGLVMIDAPVSGGAAKAASGEMTVMASGPDEAFARCGRLFDAIAARVYRLGDRAGQGSKVKMINQLLAGVHIAAAAEAMALGLRAGCDPEQLYEVISNSAGSSWMFQNRVPHILAGDWTPLSAVNIFVKDLGIVLDYAKKQPFPLPLSAAAHQRFIEAAAAGYGAEDDSAVIKTWPGIELPKAGGAAD